MILSAVRLRKWILAALPVTAALDLLFPAGGAAALALWFMLGAAVFRRPPLYPKERQPGLPRLFFSCALGMALWVFQYRLAGFWLEPPEKAALPVRALLSFSAACFSLTACEKALSLALPRKYAWIAGAALCALFAASI